MICFDKKNNTYLKSKIIYTQHEFLAINTYSSSFLKNHMLKYTIFQKWYFFFKFEACLEPLKIVLWFFVVAKKNLSSHLRIVIMRVSE